MQHLYAWFAKYIPYLVKGMVLAAGALYLVNRNWSAAFFTACIFLLIMAPTLLKSWKNIYIPVELDASLGAFIFLTLFLGALENWYGRFPIWDSILHFQSGFLLSVTGFVLFYTLNGQDNKKLNLTPGFISFSVFNFSLAASVLWEIYEYIADTRFGYHMQYGGLPDTMQDLILNAIGAFAVAVISYFWMRRTARIPLTPKKIAETEIKAA